MKRSLKAILPYGARLNLRRLQSFLTGQPWPRYAAGEIAYRDEFFRHAFLYLLINGISGDYAEFGCHGGVTFTIAYRHAKGTGHRSHFWAFDSFRGLPPSDDPRDVHPLSAEGNLATNVESFHEICAVSKIPKDRYRVVEGYYAETLKNTEPGGGDRPANIALAFVDCNLYSSARDVLAFLDPRLKNGMILALDDYFTPSEQALSGERLAFLELIKARPDLTFLPFIQFGWHGQSFIVEQNALATPPAGVGRAGTD